MGINEANELLLDLATERRNESERRSRIRAKLTYIVGGVLAFLGTVTSFLTGADWSAVFSPEGAAAAGAGIVFVRALVVLIQKRPTQ
jgi:hypothetical protein